MSELRPDLKIASVDIAERPPQMPPNTTFARADLESASLPWADASFDAITCMHVVEHLRSTANLWREIARLLKPGGRVYIETPGIESLTESRLPASSRGGITLNFYDDPTHVAPVPIADLAAGATDVGLEIRKSGRSRNWLFAAMYPLLSLRPHTRQRNVAKLHWLGWSVYLVAEKPGLAWNSR